MEWTSSSVARAPVRWRLRGCRCLRYGRAHFVRFERSSERALDAVGKSAREGSTSLRDCPRNKKTFQSAYHSHVRHQIRICFEATAATGTRSREDTGGPDKTGSYFCLQ
jgi:hypothetical protein